jgi:hypothetical protein
VLTFKRITTKHGFYYESPSGMVKIGHNTHQNNGLPCVLVGKKDVAWMNLFATQQLAEELLSAVEFVKTINYPMTLERLAEESKGNGLVNLKVFTGNRLLKGG